AAWRSAEPGLHFLERSNKRGNTWYFEKLLATNPSLRAGTRILTKQGIFPIEQLEGKKFLVKNLDGKWSEADCFLSGKNKELYRVTLGNGKEIFATAEHKWPVSLVGGGFGKVTTNKLQAGNILPFPKAEDLIFDSQTTLTREQGFMLGWLYGDGWISERGSNRIQLSQSIISPSVFGSRNVRNFSYQTVTSGFNNFLQTQNVHSFGIYTAIERLRDKKIRRGEKIFGFLFSEEEKSLADVVLQEVNKLKKLKSTLTKARGNTHTIQVSSLGFAENLTTIFGVDKKAKGLPASIWCSGTEFIKGFIDGLVSSDGFIAKNANRIILTTKHKKMAEDFSSLISFYGVKSNIRRSEATKVKFPNGKDYVKIYERYDVSIDGYHAVNFGKIFTLSHQRKQKNLQRIVNEYKQSRALPDEGLIRIQSVEKTDIKENVWDISVYDDTHCFYIDHTVTGNCGEQPLGAWAVCNLGAMNLAAYVRDEKFDFTAFGKDVKVAMRFLDNVIDETYYFFKENEKVAKDIRRTGLGIMGIADALILMKLTYGAGDSLPVIRKIFQTLRDSAYEASVEISKEKGAFPKFKKEEYLEGYHIKELPKKIRDGIAQHGIRNAVLLTIAPTGTTSLVAGVSSGIEPVYEFIFKRKWRGGEEMMYYPLLDVWLKDHPGEQRPSYFVSANDLTPLDHARVQAIAQEYIDSSISKTVNAPNAHTVEDVKTLYMAAYDMGLKGVTYMRDGSRQGVLERIDEKKDLSAGRQDERKTIAETAAVLQEPFVGRPMVVEGVTYMADSPVGKTYITVNQVEGKPFEVFITNGKSGSDVAAMADALGRMISIMLRLNSKVPQRERMRKIVSELSGLGGSKSIGFGENRVRSLPDAIAKVLARYSGFRVNGQVEDKVATPLIDAQVDFAQQESSLNGNGHVNGAGEDIVRIATTAQLPLVESGGMKSVIAESNTGLFDICPDCGGGSLAYEEGCKKCYSCGYSEC
ncbi:MAG: LAGLIDADG family homing endonuclease, partial [Patescibacteria group bacterium]